MRRSAGTALVAALVGVAVFLVGWFVVLPMFRPHAFHGAVIQSSTSAPAVDLTASTGEQVSLADYTGKVVVIYFGYTFCPDVCPTTLAKLDRALDLMGDEADEVQVIMVSVDPQRDTPEALRDYMGYFDPSFIGLTGTDDEIASVATVYGVYFQAQEGSAATGYLVDHTATLMVVDKEGYLKLVLPSDVTAEDIADDLGYLA